MAIAHQARLAIITQLLVANLLHTRQRFPLRYLHQVTAARR